MTDSLVRGLERFQREVFPRQEAKFRKLVDEGQSPGTLFITCADSRIVPDLLTGTGPGDLFVARNVGALVPPFDPEAGGQETAAAIEYAVQVLGVGDIVVCGHSHCGAIRALYEPPEVTAPNLERWLRMARGAALDDPPTEETLRRTERRSIALQVERLGAYPFVRERVDAGRLALHGWHYLIGEGRIDVLHTDLGEFRPVSDG